MHDIIIVGGGIHGAACAREFVQEGYRVLLLEQYPEPGMATSSKSSKLIHGGLRYLESGQFRLVRECLRERRHLVQSAGSLVKLVPFHIPVYTFTQRPSWMIRLGLMIYAAFSGTGFRTLPKARWSQLDGLKTEQLKTVFRYYDAQTDDQQLTNHVMTQAIEHGAVMETGACFESATLDTEGCSVRYLKDGNQLEQHSRLIINAAGPWANHVLAHITPRQSALEIDLVLGTHILVEGHLDRGMYYLESPTDKRAVFVMPWKGSILIGTTERVFHGSPADVQPPPEDISYLIEVFNHYFHRNISRLDILDSFAGLRVLPRDTGSVFHRPRETIIHHNRNSPRVFTLYGGKLTSHRATARQVLKTVRRTND